MKKHEGTKQWDYFEGKEGHLEIMRSHHNHTLEKMEGLIGLEYIEYKVCGHLIKKEKRMKG